MNTNRDAADARDRRVPLRSAMRRWGLVCGLALAIWGVHTALAAVLARADLLAGVLVGRPELILGALLLLGVRGVLLFVVPGVLLFASGALVTHAWRARTRPT